MLKTVVNFTYEKNITRQFSVKEYRSIEAAQVAAEEFARLFMEAKHQFDQVARKPDARLELLKKYSWPEDRNHKRNLDTQFKFISARLCAGKMIGVEAKVHQAVMRHVLGPTKKCYVCLAEDGFKAILSWDGKSLEQIFPSIGAACSWLVNMSKAEQDCFFFVCFIM